VIRASGVIQPIHSLDPANNSGAAVPFSAATDGRDHWLSPGEPHCADCHAAPYVEQSGNINPFPPFNYPAKASLMRYSKGHQGVTCQGCHESTHGLYPVTPTIDTTSYAQAAALNADGSHGPLKCGTCHDVDSNGIPTWIDKRKIFGGNLDEVTTWAHTYTDNASPLVDTCQNCHGDRSNKIAEDKGKWLRHAFVGRIGRPTQDKAEIETLGHVAGDPDTNGDGIPDRDAQAIADTVCSSCHSLQGGPSGAFLELATCNNQTWLQHLSQGRIAEKVWEFISEGRNGTTCGW
jgi:mono/diheme cytochrome c family protein